MTHVIFTQSYHGHARTKIYGLRIYAIMLPSSGFSVTHLMVASWACDPCNDHTKRLLQCVFVKG